MKNTGCALLYLQLCSFLLAGSALGETFCVDTDGLLTWALQIAATNDEHDVIQIAQGSYKDVYYDTDQYHDISIEGGFIKIGFSCILPEPLPSASKTSLREIFLRSTDGGNITVSRLTASNSSGIGIRAQSIGDYSSGKVEISNTVIENNGRGGIQARSQAWSGNSNTVLLQNNIIRNNFGASHGGGVEASSYSTWGQSGTIALTRNVIDNNESSDIGGGVSIYSQAPYGIGRIYLAYNKITGNDTLGAGGGIHLYADTGSTNSKPIYINNNIITDNSAVEEGGGVRVNFHTDNNFGIIMFISNTISNNQSDHDGGGLYYHNAEIMDLVNNIIWGNIADNDLHLYDGAYISAQNNNFGIIDGSIDHENNNINANPNFVGAGDYHLIGSSPCINKGLDHILLLPKDIDGDDRVIGFAPDIGADEFRKGCFQYAPDEKMFMICW